MNSMRRTRILSLAGLVVAGGAVAGPATAAQADPADSGQVSAVQPAPPEGEKILEFDYQTQRTSYYCAPAATRIALSTQDKTVTQKEVAQKLGTTRAGTDSADDTTRVLNELTGGGYETTEISTTTADPRQTDKLRIDVVEAIDTRRGVVANTLGTAVDTEGERHSFPGGHYVSIVGYRDGGETLKIADPYDPEKHYWMRSEKVADWVAQRGYSS
ncbi:C39 family peptidase [Micromonospora sp. WMMD558]|uniref:C39 family peptidase n=1 Tax=unclassified Micromonospora TaxID=2617518 RepID=UPI0012B44365|nr:C39 family peptidase [Micromonospora sp. WMMC415]QGN49653.1 phytochelatin synthase [Micromonospora sp. WMMC415]